MEKETAEKELLQSRYTGGAIVRCLMKWIAFLVSVVTLTLALPAMTCWKERYECRHTYIDGKQLRFDGRALQLMGKFIVWVLLTLITFGIYGFWLSVKMKKWKIKHTRFADERQDETTTEKESRLASMTEEERIAYEERVASRKKTAHMMGIVSLVLIFFMPPWGFIFGIIGIVFGAMYKEKFGLRLSTVAVSLLATVITVLVTVLIAKLDTVLIIVSVGIVAAAAIAACITVFVLTKNWESFSAPKEEK